MFILIFCTFSACFDCEWPVSASEVRNFWTISELTGSAATSGLLSWASWALSSPFTSGTLWSRRWSLAKRGAPVVSWPVFSSLSTSARGDFLSIPLRCSPNETTCFSSAIYSRNPRRWGSNSEEFNFHKFWLERLEFSIGSIFEFPPYTVSE